jgi:hypothetical protein
MQDLEYHLRNTKFSRVVEKDAEQLFDSMKEISLT